LIQSSRIVNSRWSEPAPVPFSSLGVGDDVPIFSPDGSIYAPGDGDIHVSRLVNGQYEAPVNLGAPVNSGAGEGAPFIAPDQSYLVFMRFRHEQNIGGVDLWISFRDRSGSWTQPLNLGERVNSPTMQKCPIVSADGRYLLFNSARAGNDDSYWMEASFIQELKQRDIR
jgi:Tol biopolymer transport system component